MHFEYENNGDSVASYKGLTIRAVQDSHASNPWQDSDGLAPLIWTSGEGFNDNAGSYDIESPLSVQFFSDRQLALKWRPICAALDCDAAELESEVRQSQKDYGGRLADIRRDTLESILSDLKPSGRAWGGACDYLAALEELWRLAGVAALDFQRSGYSQGDTVRGLLVALPAWREAMGIKPDSDMAADLESQADLLGAWAFGDCYGFVIESDGEALDSCFGYIGSDFEKSGLAEAARDSADWIIGESIKRRSAKLKELIRNRVPVSIRPALLEEASRYVSQ